MMTLIREGGDVPWYSCGAKANIKASADSKLSLSRSSSLSLSLSLSLGALIGKVITNINTGSLALYGRAYRHADVLCCPTKRGGKLLSSSVEEMKEGKKCAHGKRRKEHSSHCQAHKGHRRRRERGRERERESERAG